MGIWFSYFLNPYYFPVFMGGRQAAEASVEGFSFHFCDAIFITIVCRGGFSCKVRHMFPCKAN